MCCRNRAIAVKELSSCRVEEVEVEVDERAVGIEVRKTRQYSECAKSWALLPLFLLASERPPILPSPPSWGRPRLAS